MTAPLNRVYVQLSLTRLQTLIKASPPLQRSGANIINTEISYSSQTSEQL
uniref:Uncharacterized protein n=1 Tax=Ciona intestinalis TaxID=7719 RepID=H2XTY7_CIOIN